MQLASPERRQKSKKMGVTNLHNFDYPPSLLHVIKKTVQNGYKAFLVGGAIRDILLGKIPREYDLATNAKVEELIKLFKTYSFANKYGAITIISYGKKYELTTFRSESDYSDHRHPSKVIYVDDINVDLKRRDFTINAMAYNPFSQELVDLYHGQEDIRSCLICSVGNPETSFTEDTLRILRAIRLAAQLEFTIEPQTLATITPTVFGAGKLSRERQQWELHKILLTAKPEIAFNYLVETGLLEVILPEIAKQSTQPWLGISKTKLEVVARIAFLLRNLSAEEKKQLLTSLRYSKKMIKQVLSVTP